MAALAEAVQTASLPCLLPVGPGISLAKHQADGDASPSLQEWFRMIRQPLLGPNPTTQTKGHRQKEKKAKQEADMVAKYEDCSCERTISSAGVRWLLICAAVVFMGTVLLPKPLPEGKSDLPRERPSAVPLHHSDEAGKSSHRVAVPSKPDEKDESELKSAQKELKDELTKLDNLEEEQRKTQRVENLARLSQKENEDEARSQKNAGSTSKKRKFVADGVFNAELNEFLARTLGEDGYAGVEVRVTPIRTEIIIRATRTREVLGEKGRRIRELTALVQKRFGFPETHGRRVRRFKTEELGIPPRGGGG
eukprot:s3056_g4.t1